MSTESITHAERVRETVRDGYAEIATRGSTAGGGGCCGPACCGGEAEGDTVTAALGYAASDLAALPEGADMGLSCGNPTALASLSPGEVVLDLGSGGGLDCFVAGPKVGPAGRVIGVDMTAEMVSKARRNAETYRQRTGLDNVEFRLGEIEHLPVADASVDVVISNCVLNLSPDKAQVWREIARVLRPGGRVAVSDIALLQPLPDRLQTAVEALVGCIAGAVPIAETQQMMRAAGLSDIQLTPKPKYVKALADVQDPLYRKIADALPAGASIGEFIASVDVSARK